MFQPPTGPCIYCPNPPTAILLQFTRGGSRLYDFMYRLYIRLTVCPIDSSMACIRGHRSSKCNHTDRLMIAVRKPGRPLSSCPHLPGARCGCSNVLAALPRQPNCGCSKSNDSPKSVKSPSSNGTTPTIDTNSTVGTGSNTRTGSVDENSFTNGSNSIDGSNGQQIEDKAAPPKPLESPPVSPTKCFSRVEKKATRKLAGQKQSFDPAKLERMDANNVNIMPPMTSRSHHGSIAMSPVASRVAIPLFGDGYQQVVTSSFVTNGDYQTTPLQPWRPMTNFPVGGTTDSGSQKSTVNRTGGHSSCCSTMSNSAHETSTSSMGSAFQGVETQPQLPPRLPVHVPPQQTWPPANFSTRSFPANGNVLSPNQAIPYSLQPPSSYYNQVAMQPYPPSWGSIAHPLHPAQYQQFIDNSSQAGLQSSYQIPQSPIDLHTNGTAQFTTHQCSCGKDCQCIGCPSHPYNNSTQEFIWDAMKYQFDEDPAKGKGQGHTNSIVDSDSVNPATDRVTQLDGISPAVSNTPSDSASSPDQADHIYPAENYIFVSYPPPPGTVDICPCGPTCECIDCVIHRTLES